MNQYQIAVKPRHIRYMYFIDSNYSYDCMLKLMHHNQRYWGGRYNPIVPVTNGVIADGYINVIKNYDPDYIFYSNAVDPEIIKKLKFFNPSGYFNIDKKPRKEDILGVDALYLLSRLDQSSNVLMPEGIWETKSPLLNFFRTNFGLTSNGIVSDYEITKSHNQVIINTENFDSLTEIIHTKKTINQAHLSGKNLNTRILRNLTHAQYNSFELIIDGNKNSITDLLYFWNRHLFQCHNLFYVTTDELALLKDDEFFGGILYDLSSESTIDVVSNSLNQKEVEKIIQDILNKISFHRRFRYKPIVKFPFDVLDANGLIEREFGESTTIQMLLSETGLLFLPQLSFTNKVGFYPQKWAVDMQLKEITATGNKSLKFPMTTDTGYIIREAGGRIDIYRDISIIIHNQANSSGTLEIQIPLMFDLFQQLISNPFIHGDRIKTKFVDVALHDSSNKLRAFIKAFDGNLNRIYEYFTDKFWVDFFDKLCTSGKDAGDTFTFQELLDECKEVFANVGLPILKRERSQPNDEITMVNTEDFQEIIIKFKDIIDAAKQETETKEVASLTEEGDPIKTITSLDILDKCKEIYDQIEQLPERREPTFRNEENLALGLQQMLKSLCGYGAFLPGFKFKCPRCASTFWYPIREVNDYITCKGCLDNFAIPVDPKSSYKLNDLIKNNIYQSKTQRDGNLTVLRTLATLNKRAMQSFDYSPQINLFDDHHATKPCGDIDIVAIVDGRFTIGESKHNSSEFGHDGHKSLNSLIEVAKATRPDKVVISCYEDNHSRLEKAKKYLDHHFKHWDYAPEVEALLLGTPDYFNLSGSQYFYY